MGEVTTLLIVALVLATFVAWWLALSDLSRRGDLAGWHKTASFLVVLLVPLLGAAAYYVFRPTQRSMPAVADLYAAEQIAVVAALRRTGVITREEYDRECAAVLQINAAARQT